MASVVMLVVCELWKIKKNVRLRAKVGAKYLKFYFTME